MIKIICSFVSWCLLCLHIILASLDVCHHHILKVMFLMFVYLLKRNVDIWKRNKRYICLVDSITTHNVFNNDIYFSYLLVIEANFNTITNSEKKWFKYPKEQMYTTVRENNYIWWCTTIFIQITKNLLSFKDIRYNGCHVKTTMMIIKNISIL